MSPRQHRHEDVVVDEIVSAPQRAIQQSVRRGAHNDDLTPAGSRSAWLLRRARPIVEGTFANIFDFRFNPDFAGGRTVIQDAFSQNDQSIVRSDGRQIQEAVRT